MDPTYFFCPRVGCRAHSLTPPEDSWFHRHGFHLTKAFGRVQRYRCRLCGKTFSDQTFLLNYWLKKPTDFRSLGRQINSGSSSNFVARHHHLSADSMRIRADRLARNSLFLQSLLTDSLLINEPLVTDGLESFVLSQYFPVELNILIGAHSEFVYFFTESHSKRKGRTTEEQKRMKQVVYEGKSFSASSLPVMFTLLLDYLDGRCAHKSQVLRSDLHSVYHTAISGWNESGHRSPLLIHRCTSSKQPRDRSNPLFAVNYFDRLIRKDIPNHRRETTCQARNDRNLLSRFAYYVVTHNYWKPKRIRSNAAQIPEKHVGRVLPNDERMKLWKGRFHRYRFMQSFVQMPEYYREIWFRRTPTPLKQHADPVPQFASG